MITTRLRLPFFLLALLAIAVVVLLEFGAVGASTVTERLFRLQPPDQSTAFQQGLKIFSRDQTEELNRQIDSVGIPHLPQKIHGFGIPSMRFVDGCILFIILLMAVALLIPANIHAKIQGIVTLVFAIVLILAAVVMIFSILVKLFLMVGLLLSFPFGTIAYMFIYGSFPRGSMNVILGLLFTFKIVFCVLLLLAHQDFLKNIGLVAFVAVSFVAGLVVSFLYGLVPGVLVSITDAIAAIIVTIIGVVLGMILAIGSIPSVVKVVKL